MKILNYSLILTMLFIQNTASAAPPYVFASGGAIRASEINANNIYLENLINSAGQPQPSQLIRKSVGNGVTYTVPPSATRPYVVRQILVTSAPGLTNFQCTVSFGADSIDFIGGTNASLTIPVAAAETISANCYSSTGNITAMVVVVLSQ